MSSVAQIRPSGPVVSRPAVPPPAAVFRPLAATDARWVLAARAAGLVQGGRAALLAPDHRRRLQALAAGMGLRDFDAALVIAIVQDAARAGLDPLGRTTQERLTLIRPVQAPGGFSPTALLAASGLLGAAMFVAMAAWLSAA